MYAEVTRQGYIHTVFFELANKAVELSKKLNNAPIYAVLFADSIEEYKEGFNGIDRVYIYKKGYSTETYSNNIVELIKELEPEIMLIGATTHGRDLAPRISSTLGTGLTADCIELDINEKGQLAATRPTFGGQLMATILCKTYPQMATVRPKVFKPSIDLEVKNTEFIHKQTKTTEEKVRLLEFIKGLDDTKNELDSAEVIVAGGKGMKSEEGFKLLKEFADKIGGVVGASRGAVEMGYAPHTMQIGQTGKTVTPKLYIACGISGAIQHTVGITGSDYIISINTDPDAPIFEVSDIGVVGDVFEILPQLLEKLN